MPCISTLAALIDAREAKEAEMCATAARVELRNAAAVAKTALQAEKMAANALEDAVGAMAHPTKSPAISSSAAILTDTSRPGKRKRSISANPISSDAHVSAETSELETILRVRPKMRKVVPEFIKSK